MGADYTSWADLVTRARGIEGWRKAIRVKFPHIKNTPTNKKQAGKNSNFSSLLRYGLIILWGSSVVTAALRAPDCGLYAAPL